MVKLKNQNRERKNTISKFKNLKIDSDYKKI